MSTTSADIIQFPCASDRELWRVDREHALRLLMRAAVDASTPAAFNALASRLDVPVESLSKLQRLQQLLSEATPRSA